MAILPAKRFKHSTKPNQGDCMKALILSLCVVGALAGCHNNMRGEGPAERTGRRVDNAVDRTEDSARRAAHNAKEAADDVADRVRDDDDDNDSRRRS
jgi:hypothetical protein